MRHLLSFTVAAIVVLALFWLYFLLRAQPLQQRVYEYGIAHGQQDARVGLRRADDAEDRQTALSYLSEPLMKAGKPDSASVNLIKEVFDAPEGEQKMCLTEFARGYQEGYALSRR